MNYLQKQLDAYLDELENVRRVTPASLSSYRSTLCRFVARSRKVDDESVKCFLRGQSASTANSSLARLAGFAKFLKKPINVCRAKQPVRLPETLSSTEVAALVAACSGIDTNLAAAVEFLAETGLRFHEFRALCHSSIVERHNIPTLQVYGKGRKERVVVLSSKALGAFGRIEHFYTRPTDEKRFRSGIIKAGRQAKLPYHAHAHLLRASRASILINELGADPMTVANELGWSKLDTMFAHYCRPSLQRVAQVVRA